MRPFWGALLGLLMLSACAQGMAGGIAAGYGEQVHKVPMRDAAGAEIRLHTRICRPAGDTPARVVVINHGSPVNAADRLTRQPTACDNEAVRWFVDRGFIAVMGLRRGFGATGGAFAETAAPGCTAEGYARGAREAARDVNALVDYATALPFAKKDGVVVVGQSAGGWATIAYDGLAHSRVVAMVNMAGGRGGRVGNVANNTCRPDELTRAAGLLGATARLPMLWVYTGNDSYFAPPLVTAMHAAFTSMGGIADLVQLGPFGADGHRLFFEKGGSAIWGPLFTRYLASRGVPL